MATGSHNTATGNIQPSLQKTVVSEHSSEAYLTPPARPASSHPSVTLSQLYQKAKEGDIQYLDGISEDQAFLQKTPKGNTALHIACRFGRKDFAAKIVSRCPQLLREQNLRGDSALHVAARGWCVEVVDEVIKCVEEENQDIILGMVNVEGNTVLHEAATNRHSSTGPTMVRLLIQREPRLALVANNAKASPLYLAAEKGSKQSVENILEFVQDPGEIHRKGPQGRTPLHSAIIQGNSDIVDILIGTEKGSMEQRDDSGNCPIHYAVTFGNTEIVEKLLTCDGINAYTPDCCNTPPFLIAAYYGHVEVMKTLAKHYPDSCEAVDDKGRNALHVATIAGKDEVVKYILQSDDLIHLKDEQDQDGNTPLHLAVTHYRLGVLTLLTQKADVHIKNKEGYTCSDILDSDQNASMNFRKFIMRLYLNNVKLKVRLPQTMDLPEKQNLEYYRDKSGVISTVAGLIITVSFAAAFTIPGGFNGDGPDKGRAIFSSKAFLWLFIIADSLALSTSICLALLPILAIKGDNDLLIKSVGLSNKLLFISLVSLALAFLSGLALVLSKPLAILALVSFVVVVCFVCFWFLSLYSAFAFLSLLCDPLVLCFLFWVCCACMCQCCCRRNQNSQKVH